MSTPDDAWARIYEPLQELKTSSVESWPDRRGQFLDKLGMSESSGDPVIDALLRQLDEMPDDRRDDVLHTDQLDTLAYDTIVEHTPSAMATEQGYDEGQWAAFLTANGPVWNGTADTWQQFRDWFAYQAGEQGFGQPATALLDYLGQFPVTDRISAFARYGVTIPVTTAKGSTTTTGGGGTRTKRKLADAVATDEGRGSALGEEGADRDGDDGREPKQRRSSRLTDTADLTRPTLTFTAQYTGASTQKLHSRQNITFRQYATLIKPHGARRDITHYYELYQEVRDGYQDTAGTGHAVTTGWVTDGPYHPPYNAGQGTITRTPGQIQFGDDPGFSTTTAIAIGSWLTSYDVYFRWRVVLKSNGNEWISPVVHHSIRCPFNAGEDVAVDSTTAGPHQWQVNLS